MTEPIRIFHNPCCSKSRQTLELLAQRGTKPDIIRYLETPQHSRNFDCTTAN